MAQFPDQNNSEELKKLAEYMFGSANYEKYDPKKTYITPPGINRQSTFMKKIFFVPENTPNAVIGEKTYVYAPVDSMLSILLKNIEVDTFKHLELANPVMVEPHVKEFGSHWKFGKQQYRFIADAGILGYTFLDVETKKIVYTNTNWYILKVRMKGRYNPLT